MGIWLQCFHSSREYSGISGKVSSKILCLQLSGDIMSVFREKWI